MGKENKEGKDNFGRMLPFIKRFYPNEQIAKKMLQEIRRRNPEIDKDNLFRLLSEGKGRPNTHMSGFPEGDLR